MNPSLADAEWMAAVARARRPFDARGNRLRERWLRSVTFDADGCWIWTGQVSWNNKVPVFVARVNGKIKSAAAFTWFYILWVGEPKGKLVRYRACGKPRCVRPKCGTRTPPIDNRTPVVWADVFADLDAGVVFNKVATRHHVSRERLAKALRVAGRPDPRRTHQPKPPKPVRRPRPDWAVARAMRADGATYAQIGDALGASEHSVTMKAYKDRKAGAPWEAPLSYRRHDWVAARAWFAEGHSISKIATKMGISVNMCSRRKYVDGKAGRPWLR